jgi:hypothetical protein
MRHHFLIFDDLIPDPTELVHCSLYVGVYNNYIDPFGPPFGSSRPWTARDWNILTHARRVLISLDHLSYPLYSCF